MHKRVIYKSVLILTLLLGSSCNKFLTTLPQDGITREEFWQNKEQVYSALIGCYSSLINANALPERLFMWGEIRADNVSAGLGATIDESNMISGNILSTNSLTSWSSIYFTINLCNTFIKYAPNVLAIDKTLTQAKLDSYMSEVLGLRALMYFYLIRTFGDVPMKLTPTASDADLIQLATTKQADVLKQIVIDLNTAEKTAAFTYGDRASDKGRITHYCINAIQADVYLWMENYSACITACDKIINSGQFGYVAGDSGFFTTLYYNGNSTESIFEIQYDSQAPNSFYPIFATTRARLLANPNVLTNVFPTDNNNPDNVDIRSDVNVNLGSGQIWKYIGITARTARTFDLSYQHWIVYRYADVTLMKAEACAWSNRQTDALNIIRDVRRRANAVSSTEESPDPTDAFAVSMYVFDERDRELMYEGKRWFDILRNAKRNNYAYIDILLNIAAQSAPANSQQSIVNKYRDHNSHYLPINYTEILNDPNLIQNPFYK